MTGTRTRRAALRLGAVSVLSLLAGCSQSSGGGPGEGGADTDESGTTGPRPDGYDIRIENKTVSPHDLAIVVQTEFGEEVFFDRTTSIEGDATKVLENVVTENVEQVISVSLDEAVDGEVGRRERELLNDTIRIHPGSASAPADETIRLLIRKEHVKGPEEKQTVVDLTYEGRPTETSF